MPPTRKCSIAICEQFGGVCAAHTSATGMGTDWRDNDPEVEPMVEIYQGDRQNYERPDARAVRTAEYSIGGWEPKGFMNLALLQGLSPGVRVQQRPRFDAYQLRERLCRKQLAGRAWSRP